MNSIVAAKQRWLKCLGIFCAGLLFVLIAVIAVAALYEKEVSAYFLKKLNERLNTRVEINKVELSLLRSFPYANLRLQQVKVGHAGMKAKGYLLDVKHIDLVFGLYSLWSGDYAIKRIALADGTMQIMHTADGKNNYNLFKASDNARNDPFVVSIDQISGKNLKLTFQDEAAKVYAQSLIERAELSGKFSEKAYNLDITAKLDVGNFKVGPTDWLKQKPLDLDFNLDIDKVNKTYTFKEGLLIIADLDVAVEGQFKDLPKHEYRFVLTGKNLDIETALSLLPPEYSDKVSAYSSKGKFYADAVITQSHTKDLPFSTSARFGVEQGLIVHQKSGIELSNVNLKGELQNNVLKLEPVSMLLNKQKISGSCLIEGFEQPKVSLKSDARIQLADLGAFLDMPQFEGLKGVAELHVRVQTPKMQPNRQAGSLARYLAHGSLQIWEGAFRLKDDTLTFHQINGKCTFNQENLDIEQLALKAGASDLQFSGRFQNFIGSLIDENEPIGIKATVTANKLLLDEFFQRKSQNAASNAYRLEISPRLSLDLQARVGHLQFRRFNARDIQGHFSVNKQVLSTEMLRLKTMNGVVAMSGQVDASRQNDLHYSCVADLKAVDIRSLFFECENFSQETITDQHLKGKLDASLKFSAQGSKALDIKPASVIAAADITINNGELVRFEPLNVLGRYISLNELQHIRFSQLRNQIKISNQTIYFPLMDIESSAISISGSGTHNFNNEVDYHVRVRLSDILSKKARRQKKENESFGEIAEDGSGGLNLFLSMKGPIDNPKISYDTRGAREKRKEDIRKEKETLKTIFKEEFGKQKKDTKDQNKLENRKKQPALIMDFEDE